MTFSPGLANLKTTPVSGNLEVDNLGYKYYTNDAGRGMQGNSMYLISNAAFATVTGTANVLKPLFAIPTVAGSFTAIASTLYEFECDFNLTAISATSGNVAFGFGGTATYTNVTMNMVYQRAASINTATASLEAAVSTTTPGTTGVANQLTTAASTAVTGVFRIKGIIRVNGAGTIIPSIAQSVAAAAVVGNGAKFKITPIGVGTTTVVGNKFN
jgi:hypothetical protein